MSFQLEIHRESSDSSFGLTLSKETDKNDACKTIVIETIVPNSPASLAGFQKGDVLVSVNGQKIESLKQAAKFIKGKNRYCSSNIQWHDPNDWGHLAICFVSKVLQDKFRKTWNYLRLLSNLSSVFG